MQACFVVPVFNHGKALANVLEQIEKFALPIILVDDGNDAANKSLILHACEKTNNAILVSYKKNRGKGYAMKRGVLKAHELGATHIFQLDADGQHDPTRIDFFLERAKENPDALICGFPEYDESVPRLRKNAREISNWWARVCSLKKNIVDALCGFRIYPVMPYVRLIRRHALIDNRMGYDADILVRMLWLGVPLESHAVRVSYPADGISNFKIIRDNLHISFSFTKLFIGMILRLPIFAAKKIIFFFKKNDLKKTNKRKTIFFGN